MTWGEVSQKELASSELFAAYDIHPERLYIGDQRVRGYQRSQFEELFGRVLDGVELEEEGD